jgi:hypothetical protein
MVDREMASHNPSRHCSFAAEKVQAHAKSAPATGAHVVADVSRAQGASRSPVHVVPSRTWRTRSCMRSTPLRQSSTASATSQ